jgi:hypothetical protein
MSLSLCWLPCQYQHECSMMRRKALMFTLSVPDTSSMIIARSSVDRRICGGQRGN